MLSPLLSESSTAAQQRQQQPMTNGSTRRPRPQRLYAIYLDHHMRTIPTLPPILAERGIPLEGWNIFWSRIIYPYRMADLPGTHCMCSVAYFVVMMVATLLVWHDTPILLWILCPLLFAVLALQCTWLLCISDTGPDDRFEQGIVLAEGQTRLFRPFGLNIYTETIMEDSLLCFAPIANNTNGTTSNNNSNNDNALTLWV